MSGCRQGLDARPRMTGNGMHLFKQHAVADHEAAARLIPVIDYGPYFAGEPGALDSVSAEVAYACQNVGFFYALNHGVGDEVIERAFAASRGSTPCSSSTSSRSSS